MAEAPGHDEVDAPTDRRSYPERQHAAERDASPLGAVLRQYRRAELGVDLSQHRAADMTIELLDGNLRAHSLSGLSSRKDRTGLQTRDDQ